MASVADPFDMLSSRQSFAVGENRVTAGRLLVPVLIIELSWRVVRAGARSGLRRSHARARRPSRRRLPMAPPVGPGWRTE